MAASFEHAGQVIRPIPAANAKPAAPPTQPAAVPATNKPTAGYTAARWFGRALAYALALGTLGAAMVADGSWYVLAWSHAFGWRGVVDAPLSLLPLLGVLALCAALVWSVEAVAKWVRRG